MASTFDTNSLKEDEASVIFNSLQNDLQSSKLGLYTV